MKDKQITNVCLSFCFSFRNPIKTRFSRPVSLFKGKRCFFSQFLVIIDDANNIICISSIEHLFIFDSMPYHANDKRLIITTICF